MYLSVLSVKALFYILDMNRQKQNDRNDSSSVQGRQMPQVESSVFIGTMTGNVVADQTLLRVKLNMMECQ